MFEKILQQPMIYIVFALEAVNQKNRLLSIVPVRSESGVGWSDRFLPERLNTFRQIFLMFIV